MAWLRQGQVRHLARSAPTAYVPEASLREAVPGCQRGRYDADPSLSALPVFDLLQLTPGHFEPLLQDSLPLLDSEHAFTLLAVKRLASPSPRAEPFTLTLLAPAGTGGPQGTYTLVHPELGPLPMFLVPIATTDGRTSFEAVFN